MWRKRFLLVLLYQALVTAKAFEAAKVRSSCNSKLGMTSGAITDSSLSCSSSRSPSMGAVSARPKSVFGWCPAETRDREESWIQVDFNNLIVITEIEIIALKKPKKSMLPQNFQINYSREAIAERNLWRTYRSAEGSKMFPLDYGSQRIKLQPQLVARMFRIVNVPNGQCIQFEIYGCNFADALVSYVYVQKPNIDDYLYDGIIAEDGSIAQGGLGMLSDGILGSDNYRLRHEWVGWQKDALSTYPIGSSLDEIVNHEQRLPTGEYITILFQFESSRNFSYLMIHSNNYFHDEVQLLRAAVISFSESDGPFSESIVHMEPSDLEFDMARPVMIPLHSRIGSRIRLDLYFQSKWLMVSEILFESTPVAGSHPSQYSPFTMPRGNIWMSGFGRVEPKSATPSVILSLIALFCCTILLLLSTLALLIMKSRNLHQTMRYRTSYKSMLRGWINDHDYRGKPLHSESGNDEMETVQERLTDRTATSSYICPTLRNERIIQSNPEFTRHFDQTVHCSRTATANFPGKQCNCYWEWNPVDDEIGCWSSLKECEGRPLVRMRDRTICCNQVATAISPYGTSAADGVRFQTVRDHQLEDSCRLYDHIDPRAVVKKEERLGSSIDFELYRGSFSQRCSFSPYIEGECKGCLVKVLKPNACLVSRLSFLRDAKLMENCQSHPNLLKMVFSAPADEPPHVVFECVGVDLPDLLQDCNVKLSEADLIYLCCQICRALVFLDSVCHCLHCDIAARNCIVNPRDLHLRLGSLALLNDKYAQQYWWSKGKDHPPLPLRWLPCDFFRSHRYTVKSGVWSLAITLWEILTRAKTLPYSNLTDEQVLESYWSMESEAGERDVLALVDGKRDQPVVINEYLRRVLSNCLQPSEKNRPNLTDLEPLITANGVERPASSK